MAFKITINGSKDLLDKLERIKASVARKAARKAVKEAAKILVPAAKANCRAGNAVRTGKMRDSITYAVRQPKRARAKAYVGPEFYPALAEGGGAENPGRIAHLVEFGHGGPHPAPPHPFMRPAFEATKGAMQAAVISSLTQSLAEAANS